MSREGSTAHPDRGFPQNCYPDLATQQGILPVQAFPASCRATPGLSLILCVLLAQTRIAEGGWGPSAAQSTSQQTGGLLPPVSPQTPPCDAPPPPVPHHFLHLASLPANESTLLHLCFPCTPLLLLPASLHGASIRLQKAETARSGTLWAPGHPDPQLSPTSRWHGAAQEAAVKLNHSRKTRSSTQERASPGTAGEAGRLPCVCAPHLSPMQGRSPAWKPADSFQSCKTQLFSSQGRRLLCTLPSCLPKLLPDFTPSLQREGARAASLAGGTVGTGRAPGSPGTVGPPAPGEGRHVPSPQRC